MARLFQRVVVLVLALGVTLAVFLFWGKLGNAFRTAMEVVYAEPKPAAQPASDPNEVTVKIISQPVRKNVCGKDKEHPCPPIP
jgi:hypothetical protein